MKDHTILQSREECGKNRNYEEDGEKRENTFDERKESEKKHIKLWNRRNDVIMTKRSEKPNKCITNDMLEKHITQRDAQFLEKHVKKQRNTQVVDTQGTGANKNIKQTYM